MKGLYTVSEKYCKMLLLNNIVFAQIFKMISILNMSDLCLTN